MTAQILRLAVGVVPALLGSLLAACGEVKNDPDAAIDVPDAPPGAADADPGPDAPPGDVVDAAVTEVDATELRPPCGEWSALDEVLSPVWTQQGAFNPTLTADGRTLYYSFTVSEPVVYTASRSSATADWGNAAPVTFNRDDLGYRVEDVSADGTEVIVALASDASSLYQARRNPASATTTFAAPTRLGIGGSAASLSHDRMRLFVADPGQVTEYARTSLDAAWSTTGRRLTWNGPRFTSVDVSADGGSLLLSGADGVAVSRWDGAAWAAPVAVPGLDRNYQGAELAGDAVVYLSYNAKLYVTRCTSAL